VTTEKSGGGRSFEHKQGVKKGEKLLNETYGALGVRAYNLIKSGVVTTPELVEVSHAIDTIIAEIEGHKVALEQIRAMKEMTRGIKCPFCGSMTSPGARFCPGCGQTIEAPSAPSTAVGAMIGCPYCGAMIPDIAAFCGVCGMSMTEVQQEAGAFQVPPVPPAQMGAPSQPQPEFTAPLPPQQQMSAPSPATPDLIATSSAPTPTQSVSAERQCSHCGEALLPDATFCVNCGNSA